METTNGILEFSSSIELILHQIAEKFIAYKHILKQRTDTNEVDIDGNRFFR